LPVTLAEHIAFCFGVKRAVALAEEALRTEQPVFSTGDLVHNAFVMDRLQKEGLRLLNWQQIPESSLVLVQAHGISPEKRGQLQRRGNRLVDGTCPIVKQSFDKIRSASRGARVIVLGKEGHPEMEALKGLVPGIHFVEQPGDRVLQDKATRTVFAAQTTAPLDAFREVAQQLALRTCPGDDLEVLNTVCSVTVERERELLAKAEHFAFVGVIGGKQSSNTRKLFGLAQQRHCRAFHIASLQEAKELGGQLTPGNSVFLTSGTSASMEEIQQIQQYFLEILGG